MKDRIGVTKELLRYELNIAAIKKPKAKQYINLLKVISNELLIKEEVEFFSFCGITLFSIDVNN